MIITTSTLQALRVGVQNQYDKAYLSISEGLWWQELADLGRSNAPSEVIRIPETMSRMRKWVGPRYLKNAVEKSYTLANELYEDSFGIPVVDIEDDKWSNDTTVITAMARSGRLWPNDLVYEALHAGESTVCYDGQYFFDIDHPLEVQGAAATTQSNLHTSRALTYANYVTTRKEMMDRLGWDGKPLGIRPDLLVVPPALEETAKLILESDTLGYLANNSSTASDRNVMKGSARVLVINDLGQSSATSWYLGATGHGFKPLIYQERVAPTRVVVMNAVNDEGVFTEDKVRFGTRARGAGGYGLWPLMDKCTA